VCCTHRVRFRRAKLKHASTLPRRHHTRVLNHHRPRTIRGRRECRALAHPQPCVQKIKARKQVTTGSPKQSGIPRAMVLRLIPRSPRRSGFLSPSSARLRESILADLTPASRRQDHMASPSAWVLFVKSTFASTASRTNVRDDRETPLLVTRDGATSAADFRIRSIADACDGLARRANQFLRSAGPVKKSRQPRHGQRLVRVQTPARRQRTKRL
jgi:hypothetical protein